MNEPVCATQAPKPTLEQLLQCQASELTNLSSIVADLVAMLSPVSHACEETPPNSTAVPDLQLPPALSAVLESNRRIAALSATLDGAACRLAL